MRIKRGVTARRRHNKYLDMAKGYRGGRSKLFRTARETVEHALCDAYKDRKRKKREFRKLWIMRINAAARENSISYSHLMHGLRQAGVEIDRKSLADMAVNDKAAFGKLAGMAKGL